MNPDSDTLLPRLRPYQSDAVAAITKGMIDSDRGQLHAACGTGKTLICLATAMQRCPTGLTVVTCPTIALLAQTLAAWRSVAATALAVCSDDTVAHGYDDVDLDGDGDPDPDASVHAGDLSCPVTTDPGEIVRWLRGTAANQARLIVATHASVDRVGAALTSIGAVADLLAVDEAHRTAGRLGKHAAVVHDNTRLPARNRLYLTATPRILGTADRRRQTPADEIASMDDPAVFGPVWYRYRCRQAITDGWLDDYRVLVIGVTCAEALHVLRAVGPGPADPGDPVLRTAVVQTALLRAATEFGLRRVLVFGSRIAESRQFAETLPHTATALPTDRRPSGRLTVGHIDGTQTFAERSILLDDLRFPPDDGWTVVSSVRCLQEGVDVPAVDTTVFTRPRRSVVDAVQAVGRALRPSTGIATVLLPVLLPDDPQATPDRDDEWATVWQVLRALRAHDDDLAADLDSRRTQLRATGPADLPARVILHLPESYRTDPILRHITVRLLERTTSNWLTGLGLAKTFHAREGHLRIPRRHVEHGFNLGVWLHNNTVLHNAGILPPTRIHELEALDVEWNRHEGKWNRNMAALTAYHAREGHVDVPRRHVEGDIRLGLFANNMRSLHKQRRLPTDRIQALKALGFRFRVPDQQHTIDGNPDQPHTIDGYPAALAAAHKYFAEHRHLCIPLGLLINGVDLDHFLTRLRRKYHAKQLTPAQIAEWNQLSIIWTTANRTWDHGIAAANTFYTREGHLRVPRRHRENGVYLSFWLEAQNRNHAAGKLTTDHITALNRINALHHQT